MKTNPRRTQAARDRDEVVVSVRCIVCQASRSIRANEIPDGEMPMCQCGNVMVAEYAATGTAKRRR